MSVSKSSIMLFPFLPPYFWELSVGIRTLLCGLFRLRQTLRHALPGFLFWQSFHGLSHQAGFRVLFWRLSLLFIFCHPSLLCLVGQPDDCPQHNKGPRDSAEDECGCWMHGITSAADASALSHYRHFPPQFDFSQKVAHLIVECTPSMCSICRLNIRKCHCPKAIKKHVINRANSFYSLVNFLMYN
ncbi:hypothetical protein Ddc_11463 [Ditylenchus destructor]|nr:hypothetical protein Ddc_11463 [Ditylenchus destructor]